MPVIAMKDLEAILLRIDGRGYKAYKEIEGRRFQFDCFDLVVEHVQGDPYAAPSKLRALVPAQTAALPASALASPARRRATRDFLSRAFRAASGRHREIAIDAGRQTVLMPGPWSSVSPSTCRAPAGASWGARPHRC